MSALMRTLGRHRVGTLAACFVDDRWGRLNRHALCANGLPHAPIDAQHGARGGAVKAAWSGGRPRDAHAASCASGALAAPSTS